jgi:hypothetical protein
MLLEKETSVDDAWESKTECEEFKKPSKLFDTSGKRSGIFRERTVEGMVLMHVHSHLQFIVPKVLTVCTFRRENKSRPKPIVRLLNTSFALAFHLSF